MKFVLTRTSNWNSRAYIDRDEYEKGDAVNPLPEDDRVTREIVERENCDGEPDRVEMFFIEFDSLEELAEFAEEHGEIVFNSTKIIEEAEGQVLEIYDDYRE